MKIVIATAVYYPMINGVAVFSHNLAVGLARRGNEVMVICPSQTGRNCTRTIDGVKTVYLRSVDAKVYPDQIHAVPEKKKFLGIKLPHLVYRHGLRVSVFPQIEVKKALDEFRPDVVHVQVSDPIGLSVVWYARKHNIPVVTTEHNQPDVFTDPLKVPGVMKKPVNYLLTSYFRNRQSKSDFVTMPTEQAIKDLIWSRGKGFPVPVAAVSNGVDLSHFKPGRAPKELYKKYKINANIPVVLYVGRVDPEKKVESLIGKAASIIRKDLNSDGINKHEDKKKEVLGMLTSAIIDGLDDEERKGIIDYLSDKIQGDGESKGDVDGGSEDTSLDNETPDMGDGNENLDLSESIVKKFVKEFRNDFQRKNKNIASDIKNNKKGYRSSPFTI
jgi:glycosyltransferase involved in cell wall biosynthesis